MKERTKYDSEVLQEMAKNILSAVQQYKNRGQFQAMDAAATTLVKEIGALVVDDIKGIESKSE